MVASLRHEIRIAASPDAVWAVVTRPESIPDWFPGIVSCTVEGKKRVVKTAIGLEMPEEILTNDPLLRRFAYRITSPVYRFHLGTIDVIDLGDNESLCVYSTTAEPDTLALIVAGGTVGALARIKHMAENS
ncbi:MAG: SRPBCC family protein [Acidimicrobiales bacterium]